VTSAAPVHLDGSQFRHAALFYRGLEEFTGTVAPFIREGLAASEPVLVAELPDRIDALEAELGPDATRVSFLDMAELGANPARIIPAWRGFVEQHAGSAVRGVGEPVWAGRSPAELDECRLHESLLNVAFDDVVSDFRLLCPYDADALPGTVLVDAQRTHPVAGPAPQLATYEGHAHALGEFRRALPGPTGVLEQMEFGAEDLTGLRSVVHRLCELVRLPGHVVEDLVLATHELASNSVIHGGGGGLLRGWREEEALVLEVSDDGVIADPLVGRAHPAPLSESGRGVWLANQLCDLVQVRSGGGGTSVRVYTWL
jgi:anti-sigma regulatory factor (Ser/Thr protein kinase)